MSMNIPSSSSSSSLSPSTLLVLLNVVTVLLVSNTRPTDAFITPLSSSSSPSFTFQTVPCSSSSSSCSSTTTTKTTALFMAKKGKGKNNKKKGFAKQPVVVNEESSTTTTATSTTTTATTTATNNKNDDDDQTQIQINTNTNAGQDALARLRRQKAEQKDEELRRIREMKQIDSYVQSDPDAAVIPEQVAQRMGARMLPFVGIPLFGVMGVFIAFWYLATYQNMEFQPALVAFSTIGVLGVSLLGITYSVMSASWDPETEGSLLGIDEFKTNLGNIQDGLKRTRENAILRDKMAGMPEQEIQRAIRDLDKREERARKAKMSIQEKIQSELE